PPREGSGTSCASRIGIARGSRLAGQSQIADRDRAAALGAVAVGESVELLDIAQRMMRLALDPAAQAGLERAMLGFEGTRRQRPAVLDGEDARLLAGHGDEDGSQLDGGGIAGVGHAAIMAQARCGWPSRAGARKSWLMRR